MEASSIAKPRKKVIVLDTSAFLAGFDPFSISEEQYTVPSVEKEILANRMAKVRFHTAVEEGKLKIRIATKAFADKIEASATRVGDEFFLSEVDHQILALALELKMHGYSPSIVTDDYSMQNVADQIGIEFVSLSTFGIRHRLEWLRYCPACYRRYPAKYKHDTCEVCGTQLKRRPLKKKKLRHQEPGQN